MFGAADTDNPLTLIHTIHHDANKDKQRGVSQIQGKTNTTTNPKVIYPKIKQKNTQQN